MHFVYLIGCCGYVKIGIADDATQRLLNMQTGCPFDLVLLRAVPSKNSRRDEEGLHLTLWRYDRRGEWFELPGSVLAKLMSLKTFKGVWAGTFKDHHHHDWQI